MAKGIKLDDYDVPTLPDELTPEEKREVFKRLKLNPDSTAPITTRVKANVDNSEMLGEKSKKKTQHDKVLGLFKQQGFSPMTLLVRQCKIEGAKVELYERAIASGMDSRELSALPPPNKRLYIQLCLELLKYEVPTLSSLNINGKVDSGLTIQIINAAPQQKVVRIDEGSPEKLRKLALSNGETLSPNAVLLEDKPANSAKVIEMEQEF